MFFYLIFNLLLVLSPMNDCKLPKKVLFGSTLDKGSELISLNSKFNRLDVLTFPKNEP